ncbi:Protein of unknown function DUF58 [Arsukibacterium tuosuense]|uniref:DUF58 domain-containing protein n=1 Tax=Arsukibacterium tuosuense TaxID=1323745 RepID=A0A285IU13_9GAMM|nr:DUF58 domain-containing protein [Arsukibacterium tuosuense]SNY51499.1 Protein of unknown function DUF58 [Arsukibacterium tuosuense]
MTTAFSASQWLKQLSADGSSVKLPELLWYQRHTKVLNLKPTISIQSKLAGTYLARSKGRGMEFDEVRHYQPGDDVRTIDWRVTARSGKVHTKLFREEKERPVFIVTDLTDSMRFGSSLLFKSVQAAHLAAVIAWHVKQHGDKLGGLVFSNQQHRELKPQGRSHGVLRYLQALQQCHQSGAKTNGLTLTQALGQQRRLSRPGSLVYILSDFNQLDEQALRHIRAISQHNEVTCCQISDPLELALPSSARGIAAIRNQQQVVSAELADSGLRTRYQQQQQQQQRQLAISLQQVGCKWLDISAGDPIISQLEQIHHGR